MRCGARFSGKYLRICSRDEASEPSPFIGMMTLCFVTTLLIDTKLYTSAAFTGLLAATLLLTWLLQYWRVRQEAKVRQSRRDEAAIRRQASEKLDNAKSAMADAARTVGKGAANTFGAATSGIASASGRMRFWKRDGAEDTR
jgi:hypothetical protein